MREYNWVAAQIKPDFIVFFKMQGSDWPGSLYLSNIKDISGEGLCGTLESISQKKIRE